MFTDSDLKPSTAFVPQSYPNEATSNNFTPNYAKNPEFHYANSHLYNSSSQGRENPDTIGAKASEALIQSQISEKKPFKREFSESVYLPASKIGDAPANPPEYVTIKIRSHLDDDFIEIDIDKANLSIDQFKELCNRELGEFDKSIRSIIKIRKLPNVLVRNTTDIKRFRNDQEIELIYSDQK